MKKYIIFTLFLFTLFFINVSSVSADFSSCPSKTHSWPTETPGSTWSWTVTDRSEMIRGLESISGINSGTTYNASTGVFAGGDPTVFGLSANATTAEIGILARQWSGISNKNIDFVLNGLYSTNPQLKKIAMAEIVNSVAVVGSADSAGRQYLAELDGSKMTEIYNAYLAAYPTTSKDWINQLWNQMAPTCGKIIITSNINTGNNTPAPSEPSTKFKIGDTLKTTSSINVRGTSNGNIIDVQKINSYGTIIAGPETGGGYSWWKIDFQTGPDGWSAENYFVKSDIVSSLSSSATTVSLNYNNSTNPVSVTSGGSVNFSWSATNINKCQMFKNDTLYNDGVYNTYGVNTPSYSGTFYVGNITSSATYTLTCTGAGGSRSASMTVNVSGQNTSLVPGCTSTAGSSTTTGQSCNPSTAVSIPGCTSRSGVMRVTGFSTITGQSCAGNSSTPGGTPPSTPPVTPPSTPPATGFNIGDTVSVKSEITLNVRATASSSGTLLGKQNGGATGKLVAGPTTANGYTWWKIDYNSGIDGWSAENYLVKVTETSTPEGPTGGGVNPPAGGGTGDISKAFQDQENIKAIVLIKPRLSPNGASAYTNTGYTVQIGERGWITPDPLNGTKSGGIYWWNAGFDRGTGGWVNETEIAKDPTSPNYIVNTVKVVGRNSYYNFDIGTAIPAMASLAVYSPSEYFGAFALDPNGGEVSPVGLANFTWTSSNPAVAKIGSISGLHDSTVEIIPVSVGTATITATNGGKSGTGTVTVTPYVPKFQVNDRFKVINNAGSVHYYVYPGHENSSTTTRATIGDYGTILEGPVHGELNWFPATWYKIKLDNNVTGWMTDFGLEKLATTTCAPLTTAEATPIVETKVCSTQDPNHTYKSTMTHGPRINPPTCTLSPRVETITNDTCISPEVDLYVSSGGYDTPVHNIGRSMDIVTGIQNLAYESRYTTSCLVNGDTMFNRVSGMTGPLFDWSASNQTIGRNGNLLLRRDGGDMVWSFDRPIAFSCLGPTGKSATSTVTFKDPNDQPAVECTINSFVGHKAECSPNNATCRWEFEFDISPATCNPTIYGIDPQSSSLSSGYYYYEGGKGKANTVWPTTGGNITAIVKAKYPNPNSREVTKSFVINTSTGTTSPSGTNPPSIEFQIGDTVKTASNINVRSSANGNIVDIQKINSYGTVVSGPETGGGYSWWKINFQSGVEGWSAENYLVESALP